MDKPKGRTGTRPAHSCCFSADTVRDLRVVLGDSRGFITRQLESLVNDNRRHGEGAAERFIYNRPLAKPTRLEINRLASALRTTVLCIDSLSERARGHLIGPYVFSLSGMGRDRTDWDAVATIRKNATLVVGRADGLSRLVSPGKPVNTVRQFFAFEVALLLHLNKVNVTTSRDGTFGRVLAIVLHERFSDSVPEDLFRVIKQATHALAPAVAGDSQFLAFVFSGLSNPSFWSRFLVR